MPSEIHSLIFDTIEHLRPKLLDLTRNNPLISTKMGDRSTGSYIRVVDELPDVLLQQLIGQKSMKFSSLPPDDAEPADEKTKEFNNAYLEAILIDEVYLEELRKIDEIEEDDTLDKIAICERDLKDRLREKIGLPAREIGKKFSHIAHARIHGISPSYQLPEPTEEHTDGRHTDDLIQTLQMPDKMERSLSNIISKNKSWEQETGIAVLQGAFGFLEWTDGTDDRKSLSPLVLTPVKIEKRKTVSGLVFDIMGKGDEAVGNSVLAEKLDKDMHIKLPPFVGPSVEGYLEEIAAMKPDNIHWRVKRYVTFGVFPSARMSMYHDLDLNSENYIPSEMIEKLLTSAPTGASGILYDDYDVDSPEVEQKVPIVITDADSSQFSVMVDVSNGENLAVEGPPGTGKSQTIVNTIASAINSGKKVLFVAEKLAALDVVKSRLEAWDLGEFVLPLQANRSAREQVIQSVRDRLDMYVTSSGDEYEKKVEGFKGAREEIANYLNIMKSEYQSTGYTVHEILGKHINSRHHVKDYGREIQTYALPGIEQYTKSKFEHAISVADEIKTHWNKIKDFGAGWRGAEMTTPTRFEAEDISEIVLQMGEAAKEADNRYLKLNEDLRALEINKDALHDVLKLLTEISESSSFENRDKIQFLTIDNNLEEFKEFVGRCGDFQRSKNKLDGIFVEDVTPSFTGSIEELDRIAHSLGLENIGDEQFRRVTQQVEDKIDIYAGSEKQLARFFRLCPEMSDLNFETISSMKSIIAEVGKELLALRSSETTGLGSEHEIEEILRIRNKFAPAHDEIKSQVNMLRVGDLATLEQHIDILSNTHSLGRLFGKYKQSFGYGKSVINNFVGVDRFSMISKLDQVRSILMHERGFANRTSSKLRLPGFFKGVDTDFELLQRYMDFISVLEGKFIGVEGTIIKNFIFQQPYDVLVDIPDVGDLDTDMDLSGLRDEIKKVEDKKDYLDQLGNRFSEHSALFRHPEEIAQSDLKDIASSAKLYCDIKQALSEEVKFETFLGEEYRGGETSLDILKKECEIASLITTVEVPYQSVARKIYLSSLEQSEIGYLTEFLNVVDKFEELSANVKERTKISFEMPKNRSYSDFSRFLMKTGLEIDGLLANAEFHVSKLEISEYGFTSLVNELIETDESLNCVENIMTAIFSRNLAVSVYNFYGTGLSKFRGEKLSRLRKQLADYDLEIQKLSRKKIRNDLISNARTISGNSSGRRSGYTEMAMLHHQVGLTRAYQPVRELIRRAGTSLQALKPCWMMSPLAIAQYIDQGAVEFDLCIIDEASQMTVENSIGALLRSKQVMIVGDTNQLPPSSFFKKMINTSDDVDEDLQITEESILDKANSVLTKRQLKWHYRSRHSGLIAYSNKNVYDDKLIVFPSANEIDPNMGIKLVETKSSYHSGVNKLEADKIVEAALRFMKDHPKRSLGIVALNKTQAGLIEQELEHARYQYRHAQDYYEFWENENDGLESFFVKNLENVQGDERDVIFISTVYGPSAPGVKVAQQFGPINGVAGKRRLNVLFSRAKEQIVTFSSMKPTDIVVEDPSLSNGRSMLKGWLEYSATGKLPAGIHTEREPDSEFEIAVIREIEAMGLQAVPQVGSSNYFIDIGIKHPNWPYGFVLGVECDGATYHSSKSARDRDRIRQSVLEGLGWTLHRIWSTDWFNDPASQVSKLREVVEECLATLQTEFAEKEQNEAFFQAEKDEEIYREAEYAEDIEEVVIEPDESKFGTDQAELDLSNVTTLHADSVRPARERVMTDEIEIGDRITFKYMDRDQNRIVVTLSDVRHEPENGIVNIGSDLGGALIGAELEEEISVLVGPYLRKGVIEKIEKMKR